MKIYFKTALIKVIFPLAFVTFGVSVSIIIQNQMTEKSDQASPRIENKISLAAKPAEISHDESQKKLLNSISIEGAHWAGCDGSLAKIFDESFHQEILKNRHDKPITLGSERVQFLRQIPSISVEFDEENEQSTPAPQIDDQIEITPASRCRTVGILYGHLSHIILKYDFAFPMCAQNMKHWGIFMADFQCRAAKFLPSNDPLPIFSQARVVSCTSSDLEKCTEGFNARSQNLGEKCGLDSQSSATNPIALASAKFCFRK